MTDIKRVAIVGTPRAGNVWLSRMAAAAYGLELRAVHYYKDLNWDSLPSRCIVQLHWHPDEDSLALLRHHGFKPLVLFRHPLDVLVSILHFARYNDTGKWLDGENGGECAILQAAPADAAFLEYAASPRAASLLGLSAEWCELPGVLALRYEALVENPAVQLEKLGAWLGTSVSAEDLAEAVASNTLGKNQETTLTLHFWQGKPGLWRKLIPAADARRIALIHRHIFERAGYLCDPDETLTHKSAKESWNALLQIDFDEHIRRQNEQITSLNARIAGMHERILTLNSHISRLNEHIAGRNHALIEKDAAIRQHKETIQSAEQWQASWFRRAFQRWHAPGNEPPDGFFQRLQRSIIKCLR